MRREAESNGPVTHLDSSLHPARIDFMRFCHRMQNGEIDQLRIQNGLPLLAETVRQQVKFSK